MSAPAGTLGNAATVLLAAVLTVLGADLALRQVVPLPHRQLETSGALASFANRNPQVLFLGSSYARSFLPLAEQLGQAKTPVIVSVVPIEGGKMVAYDWLVRNRVQPLIRDGRVDRLREFVLVTSAWDLCDTETAYPNLPARAWGPGNYAADLARNGATSYNANFLAQRWDEWLGWSVLVRDRGVGRIIPELRARLAGTRREDNHDAAEARLKAWIGMLEETDVGQASCPSGEQQAAFRRLMAFAHEQDFRIRIVTWPNIPKAMTPKVAEAMGRFRTQLMADAGPGVELVDLSAAKLLDDADFRPDLDHLESSGEEKVTRWALTGPFSDLASGDLQFRTGSLQP